MRGICFHGFYMCSKILHIICIHILPRCGPSVYCILVNGMLEKAFHAHFPFLSFPACFWIPIIFSNLNSNCSDLLDLRNLQEQVKKALCYQTLLLPFTVWVNCSSDIKNFANSWPSGFFFRITLIPETFVDIFTTNHLPCCVNVVYVPWL